MLLAVGCSKQPTHTAVTPRMEETRSGPLTAQVMVEPGVVHLDQTALLTVKVTAPSNVTVRLPSIEGRLRGFSLNGWFDREPRMENGTQLLERCATLFPQPGARFRIAPMAIRYTDGEGVEHWFATRPLRMEAAPVAAVRGSRAGPRPPEWIPPDRRFVAMGIGMTALAVAAAVVLFRLLRRWRRAVRLRRLSPRQRALLELEELLAKDLVGRGRVKDFYYDLTMIVRAYIERAHGIRAPEQTTEEFLAAMSIHPCFTAETAQRLRAFLRAADLVKYAAQQPDAPAVQAAIQTARNYIENDTETPAAQSGKV